MPRAVTPDPRNPTTNPNLPPAKPKLLDLALNLGQGFLFFKDPSYRKLILTRSVYGLFFALFCFSIYTTISTTFWLQFLEPITTGLNPIGKVLTKTGTSTKTLPDFRKNKVLARKELLFILCINRIAESLGPIGIFMNETKRSSLLASRASKLPSTAV